ncbi:GUN4 domain-containing protein [Nostoc sp. CALU 546]|uniref:GUN4 domain-containing protein n=1 Tax=Nostoc sp. CALU 546 TaxID=1867241 RepID=UPI003B6802FC
MLDTNSSISVTSVDYSKLQELLEAGNWAEADNQTFFILFKLAGLENCYKLDVEHIQKISESDLKAIDQLWVNYSNGNFGFSVQKSLYNQSLNMFCVTVGWVGVEPRYYASQGSFYFTISYDITDITAPKGHLPACILRSALKNSPLQYGKCSWGRSPVGGDKRIDAESYFDQWCETQLDVLQHIHFRFWEKAQ